MRRALARTLARALAHPAPSSTLPATMLPRPPGMAPSGALRHAASRPPGLMPHPAARGAHRLPSPPMRASISSSAASKKDKVVYECGDCGVQLAQKKGCCPECGAWGR